MSHYESSNFGKFQERWVSHRPVKLKCDDSQLGRDRIDNYHLRQITKKSWKLMQRACHYCFGVYLIPSFTAPPKTDLQSTEYLEVQKTWRYIDKYLTSQKITGRLSLATSEVFYRSNSTHVRHNSPYHYQPTIRHYKREKYTFSAKIDVFQARRAISSSS